MMKTTTIGYNIAILWTVVAFMGVCVVPDWKTNIATAFGCLVLCGIHYAVVIYNKELVPYAEAFQPIAVVDWGPFGKDMKLPDHLSEQYILCSAADVASTIEMVKKKLEAAENPLFVNPPPGCPPLEVYGIYYAEGQHCNEGKKYRKRVIATMEEKRLPWHVMLHTGEWDGKPDDIEIPEGWYRENYLETLANGSLKG